jgi:hypothetical protein
MKDVIVSFLMFIGLVSALFFFVSIIFDWGIDMLLASVSCMLGAMAMIIDEA